MFALLFAIVVSPAPQVARAQGEQWLITGLISASCTGPSTLAISFVGLVDGPVYYFDTIAQGGGVLFMDEIFPDSTAASSPPGLFPGTAWGIYNSNNRGLQTGTLPILDGSIVTVTATLRDGSLNPLWRTVVQYNCSGGGFVVLSSGPVGAGVGGFEGPPLPGPEGRNLVLINADTPVYDEPGGKPTGEVLKACQTAFVLEIKEGYGRIYVMGGWIPLGMTSDVAEDYGQPGGQPIVPQCVDH